MSDFYETQRAMRNMRRVAMNRGVVALIDIGTAKVACFIMRFEGAERARDADGVGPMAGQSQFRIIGAKTTRSGGMRHGEIARMADVESAMRTAVQGAQKMAGVRVDHAIVCFSGAGPRSYGLAGDVELADQVVTEGDVARALAACDLPPIGAGREVLHAQPVNFMLDHRSGLGDPRGQIGHRLACDMHMLTVDAVAVENIVRCVNRCDLEVAGIASSAYVAGLSSLVEDEQELGAACIDMGGGSTGVSIFIKKHMIFADAVRMGGDHVTNDIALGLQIGTARAEELKTRHGGVHATGRDDREMIEIGGDSGDWEKDRRQVSRSELIGIIRPRVEEILEAVRESFDAAGFDYLNSRQIVLTGGASQIPGLDGIAARVLGQRVRLGRPLRIRGAPNELTGPAAAALAGLCLFAANPQDEWWDFQMPIERYPARSVRRAVRWLRDNW